MRSLQTTPRSQPSQYPARTVRIRSNLQLRKRTPHPPLNKLTIVPAVQSKESCYPT